jgi:hypothetical protein
MGYEEVNSLDADVVISLGKVDKKTGKSFPKEVEGYYLGSRTTATPRGDSTLHVFQFGPTEGNPNASNLVSEYRKLNVNIGESVGVWGTTSLNIKLGEVKKGAMTLVTSTGTKPTKNGDMYTYRVKQDKNNVKELDNDDGSYNAEYLDASNDPDASSDDDSYDLEAAALAAERKAKVEAAIRGNSANKNK